MTTYKVLKIKAEEKEDDIEEKINDLAHQGWKMMSWYPSSESTSFLKNGEPWTNVYVFVFIKEKKK